VSQELTTINLALDCQQRRQVIETTSPKSRQLDNSVPERRITAYA